MTEKYDVVIIGAGIGGMTAANKLSKNGHSVLLVEQHDKLGGLASWFKRKNHIFDISLHGFPESIKSTFKIAWSKELSNSVIRVNKIRFDNPQFALDTNYDKEDFQKILANKFKVRKSAIKDFFKVIDSTEKFNFRELTLGRMFKKYFPGRNDVVRFLMEPITYANGLTFSDPASVYGIVLGNFIKSGVYTFRGGTDRMIEIMKNELLKNKVTIAVSKLVKKIIIRNKQVYGVLVNGKIIYSKVVVSDANLLSTICDLAGLNHFPKDFVRRVRKTRLSNSHCQVYLGIKNSKKISFDAELIFFSNDNTFSPNKLFTNNFNNKCFTFYGPTIRNAEKGLTIVATYNARYEDWSCLTKEKYLKTKMDLIKSAISSLEKYIPDIKESIDFVDASTPLTFERYTLHKRGATFGTKYEGLDISMNIPHFIKGLFHTGSVGIIMSSWLGTMNYGILISHNIRKYLTQC